MIEKEKRWRVNCYSMQFENRIKKSTFGIHRSFLKMATMLTKTFNSAIRGYHYYRKNWYPKKEEHLVCSHEEDNAFDIFAIKTCKADGTIVGHLPRELSRTLKFLLIRGARIFADLTSTHYRRSPLVQGGLEISCKVTVEMSPTRKNIQLLDRVMELVEATYAEPTSPVILGSFLADEIEVDFLSKEQHRATSKETLKQKKITVRKETKSFDIRDMFSGKIPSKKPRLEEKQGKKPDTIIID